MALLRRKEAQEKKLDRRAAMQAWAVFRAHGGKKCKLKLEDFMPKAATAKVILTPQQLLAKARVTNLLLGGRDKRNVR